MGQEDKLLEGMEADVALYKFIMKQINKQCETPGAKTEGKVGGGAEMRNGDQDGGQGKREKDIV